LGGDVGAVAPRFRITVRETVFSELGVEAARPITRAVGMAVIRNPFAGQFVEVLRLLFEAGATLGERLMPELVKLLGGPAVSYGKCAIVGVAGERSMAGSNVKVATAGALLDVPLGHNDNFWSFPHFDTITVSVAGVPRPDEILVVMAIRCGERLRSRCGTDPVDTKKPSRLKDRAW
jgi:amino acid synthesis protein